MKVSFCMLSAAVAVCAANAAALAQYNGGPRLWQSSGPQAGANSPYSPFDPSSPGGVRNPFDPPSSGEWQSQLGQYRAVPPEPVVGDFIDQNPIGEPNPAASAAIPPEVVAQLANPPRIEPFNVPAAALPSFQPPPPAAAPWQDWEWLAWAAAGVIVLGLLGRLLRDCVKRKDTTQ
ncbi:MAG TPA: hypothetical protein VMS17_24685 [Gemmataceae bacterium]|nr:hypothetical protein [Gemmataceae bacterium]